MNETQATTKPTRKPSRAKSASHASSLSRPSSTTKRGARAIVRTSPANVGSVQLATPFSTNTIRTVVELMSCGGDHSLPHEASKKLRAAYYRDWHAAFIVRAAAEEDLPEERILRVLIDHARHAVETVAMFRRESSSGALAMIQRCEDLIDGKLDLSDSRTFYETRGMIDYAPQRESLWGFTCSLLEAAFDLVRNDEREARVSHEIERAAQHMVREFFDEYEVAMKHLPTSSTGGVRYPLDTRATALAATDGFVAELKTKLELAIAARKAA
jgi:hypothetical protein